MAKTEAATFLPFLPVRLGQRDRAWAEINLARLRHNALAIRAALPPGCELVDKLFSRLSDRLERVLVEV